MFKPKLLFLINFIALWLLHAEQTSLPIPVHLDSRLCLTSNSTFFIYTARNLSSSAVEIDLFQQRGNCLGIIKLSDLQRKPHWSSLNVRMISKSKPQMVLLYPYKCKKWTHNIGLRYSSIGNGYEIHTWRVRVGEYPESLFAQSQNVCLGFPDADGVIAKPVVGQNELIAHSFLAFIFHENQSHEIGFLLLNGSDEVVTIDKPLTQSSCIVATAPTIGYTNELHIVGQAPERISVDPGKVGEWRIPWSTIHDLIPADDLTAIKAAGGDLDLVWRVGAYQSDPLPLSLAPPAVENGAVGEDNQQEVGR